MDLEPPDLIGTLLVNEVSQSPACQGESRGVCISPAFILKQSNFESTLYCSGISYNKALTGGRLEWALAPTS